MQTIIRGGPTDLIAYAWFRIGFRPRESVVLVGIRGPRRQSGVVARGDIPPPSGRRAAVAALLELVSRAGDEELLALVVSDVEARPRARAGQGTAGRSRPELPHRALVKELRAQARATGLPVIDVLAVGPDSYRSYLCHDDECCPPGGLPLSEVMASRTAAQMVLDGRVLADAEADIVADVMPESRQRDRDLDIRDKTDDVAGCADSEVDDWPEEWVEDWPDDWVDAWADQESVDAQDDATFTAAQRVEMLDVWRRLLQTPGADESVLWLALALEDGLFRDVALLTLVTPPLGPGEGPERDLAKALLLADGKGFDEHLGAVLSLAEPDEAWLERGRVVLSAVARRAPQGWRAAALALLAWTSWWAGDGARARLLARRALDDRPDHRLAWLVDQLLLAAIPPPWVSRAS